MIIKLEKLKEDLFCNNTFGNNDGNFHFHHYQVKKSRPNVTSLYSDLLLN